jgi:hypothetical protein
MAETALKCIEMALKQRSVPLNGGEMHEMALEAPGYEGNREQQGCAGTIS